MKKGQYITTLQGWTIRLYNTKGGASYIATRPGHPYKIDESIAALKTRIQDQHPGDSWRGRNVAAAIAQQEAREWKQVTP